MSSSTDNHNITSRQRRLEIRNLKKRLLPLLHRTDNLYLLATVSELVTSPLPPATKSLKGLYFWKVDENGEIIDLAPKKI